MRPETQKRLLGILEADIAKLQEKIDANPLAEYSRLTQELNKLADPAQWKALKTEKAINQVTAEVAKLQLQRDKAFRAHKSQMKNMEPWFNEQYALQRDLSDLQRSYAYPIH